MAAVKGFTYMDQAAVPKPVDLARGLSDTLTMLRAKAKSKSVRVSAQVEPDLPTVDGFGGELNQVWSNLIDNAIDAVGDGGSVEVSARRQDGAVVVRVVDDGPGIPPEVRGRIFEPFFTTKPQGEGTGLGLAIAQNPGRPARRRDRGRVTGRAHGVPRDPAGGRARRGPRLERGDC